MLRDGPVRGAGFHGGCSTGQGGVGGEPRGGQVHHIPEVQDWEVRARAGADAPRQGGTGVPQDMGGGRRGSLGQFHVLRSGDYMSSVAVIVCIFG